MFLTSLNLVPNRSHELCQCKFTFACSLVAFVADWYSLNVQLGVGARCSC